MKSVENFGPPAHCQKDKMKSRDLVEPFGSGVWLRRSIRSVRPHPEARMREAQQESRDLDPRTEEVHGKDESQP